MAVNADLLGYMSDDSVSHLYRRTERDLYRTRAKSRKKHSENFREVSQSMINDLEWDLCYIFRELEHRQKRKEAHQRYLKKIQNHLHLTPSRRKRS